MQLTQFPMPGGCGVFSAADFCSEDFAFVAANSAGTREDSGVVAARKRMEANGRHQILGAAWRQVNRVQARQQFCPERKRVERDGRKRVSG